MRTCQLKYFRDLAHCKLDKRGDIIYHPKPDQGSGNPLSNGAWHRTHLQGVCRPCHNRWCFDYGAGFPLTGLVSDGDHLSLLFPDGVVHSAPRRLAEGWAAPAHSCSTSSWVEAHGGKKCKLASVLWRYKPNYCWSLVQGYVDGVYPAFPDSQGTVVMLPVQLHQAVINLDQVSHNDSTQTRGVLTALQEEGLALCTDVFIPRAANPVLTPLPALGSLCLCTHAVLISYDHFNQLFPSNVFFLWNKKSGYCETFIDLTGTHSAAGQISYLQLGAGYPKLPADVWAKLAPAHCCILFPESTDIALLCWCHAQISTIPAGAGASTGRWLKRAFHIRALLLLHFQLVIDKYLLLPHPKGLTSEQGMVVEDIVLWMKF